MSTDWGFGCETCGVHEHYEAVRGTDHLTLALRCAPAIAAAFSALVDVDGPKLRLDLGSTWTSDEADAVAFLAAHIGHKMRVTNEYGEHLEDCPVIARSSCGHEHYSACAKPWDHPGACDGRCCACRGTLPRAPP